MHTLYPVNHLIKTTPQSTLGLHFVSFKLQHQLLRNLKFDQLHFIWPPLYCHLHNSVNTEIFFFGCDVTSHLIKHSFPLLSPDDTAQPRALFFCFSTDRDVFDICLLNHGWFAGAFCKRISYFTMFSETVHDFFVTFDTSLIEWCLVPPSAKC